MAKKDKLTKSKSIYTIKKKHATVKDGTIYENDYTSILPNDGLYADEMPLFNDSIFKYKIRTNSNEKRRHTRGEFVKTDNGSSVWTLNDVSATTTSDESRIVLKPNYSSLKDFAYYGSAVELIKATVNDIILRFPGGLSYYGPDDAPVVRVGDTDYYLVSNEFNIDCWTAGGNISSGDVSNPMRVLAATYMNYEKEDGSSISTPSFTASTQFCLNSIIGEVSFGCGIFQVYMDANYEKHLISKTPGTKGKVIIRPKKYFIDEFWNTMDDFEKVLLNRDTTPVYKASFETPYSNENGYFYSIKDYVWPTVGDDGFTPDITTGRFQGYLESLISLADFHDTYDSDNIWRMQTHEAIKNLDWTFISKNGDETEDNSDIDSSRIQAMLRIYGRLFDDIKRYTDNIKTANAISYDEKDNTPDYFLSDNVEIDGWQAQNVAPFPNLLTDTITEGNAVLEKSGKTPSYVNSAFLRRLALNSDYIQSMKGTRRGIETILRMFGYTPDNDNTKAPGTFDISEYVAVCDNTLPYNEAGRLRALGEYVYDDETTNFMEGYPVAAVIPAGATNPEDTSKWYLVPWFDKDTTYRTPMYFQEKGGWSKQRSKSINLSSLTSETTIFPGNTVDLYGETTPYMRYATNIDDMLALEATTLRVNTVCYVTDISSMYQDGFYIKDTDDKSSNNYSHYFVLKNTALSSYVGFVDNNLYHCYGWRNVSEEEIANGGNVSIDGQYEDGLRVLYLESLTAYSEGNNPHVGFGDYDDGDSYLERFRNLFSDMYQEGKFDYLSNSEDADDKADYERLANGYGFNVRAQAVEDNKKCAFYEDPAELGKSELDAIDGETVTDWNANTLGITYNPETNVGQNGSVGTLDESQANLVINIKRMKINFNTGKNEYLKQYIQNVVLKYLEPMIPSTTISEYTFDGEAITLSAVLPTKATGSIITIEAAHAAIDNDNKNIIVWAEYPDQIIDNS